jgi:hypothetical protein
MFWRVDRLSYCPPLPDSRDEDGRTGPLRLPAPNIDICHHCFRMLSDGIMLEHFRVPVWPHVASTEEMERRKRAVAGGCSESRGLQLQTSATRLPAAVIDFRTYSKLTARRSNTELNRGFSIVIGIAPDTRLVLWAYLRKGGTECGSCPHNLHNDPLAMV